MSRGKKSKASFSRARSELRKKERRERKIDLKEAKRADSRRTGKALEGVPDGIPVRLSSDTGVDQGYGAVIVESATYIKGDDGWFDIYANDHYEEPDCEPLTPDEEKMIKEALGDAKETEEILNDLKPETRGK